MFILNYSQLRYYFLKPIPSLKQFFLLLLAGNCCFALQAQRPNRCKDIQYTVIDSVESEWHQLDVYYPGNTNEQKPVLIFIHGGSWESGKKETYRLMGKHLAKSGVVTVIINYRLTEVAMISDMTYDAEQAMNWTLENIQHYGGDTSRIIVSGHSAGGHLAAMVSLGKYQTQVHKTILIDAFGLDMITYFQNYDNEYAQGLRNTFSKDSKTWKDNSPLYQVPEELTTPFLILTGGRTFPTIKQGSTAMAKKLGANGTPVNTKVFEKKKHVPMITQFFFKNSDVYDTVLPFVLLEK